MSVTAAVTAAIVIAFVVLQFVLQDAPLDYIAAVQIRCRWCPRVVGFAACGLLLRVCLAIPTSLHLC